MVQEHVFTSVLLFRSNLSESPYVGLDPEEKAVSAGLIMQAFLGIGKRRGMLKVRPLRTDLFACSKIVLVFLFILK